jgi:hypothetical protein
MSQGRELLRLAREQNTLLHQIWDKLSRMSLVMPMPSSGHVGQLLNLETPEAACRNLIGMLPSDSLVSVWTALMRRTNGLQDSTTTRTKKPRRDLHALDDSPVQPHAKSSTRSTPPRAKRARIGGRSKAQYHLVVHPNDKGRIRKALMRKRKGKVFKGSLGTLTGLTIHDK